MIPLHPADRLFKLNETGFFLLTPNVLLALSMTEMFPTMYGQNEAQGPPGSLSMGFGPGKLPLPMPQNQVSMAGQMPPQLGDEGPAMRKPGAMNEPFYLLRELPGNVGLLPHRKSLFVV